MAKFEAGMEAMLDMFVFETSELLEKLDEILMRTESGDLASDDIAEIFRIMHTVKGSAAMMGLQNMSKLAHAVEDLFFIIREDPDVSFDKEALYELLYKGSDSLKFETDNISDDSVPLSDFTEQINAIRRFADVMKGAEPERAASGNGDSNADDMSWVFSEEEPADLLTYRVVYEQSCMMPEIRAMVLINQLSAETVRTIPEDLDADGAGDEIMKNGFVIKLKTDDPDRILEQLRSGINVKSAERLIKKADAPAAEPKEIRQESKVPPTSAPKPSEPVQKKAEDKGGAMISVKLDKLDRLMKLAQEIVIAQSGVLHCSDLAPYKNSIPNFDKSARELKKLTDELQDMVMSVRMVPISSAFSKMNRVVRDMNKNLGKNVTLVFEGDTTEVDKSVCDMLGDPLMHLVRNAVDHGIETPEDRAASGKTEPPKVTLKAYYESNNVLISVIDNGYGMDSRKLLSKAKKRGLLTKSEQEYTEQECFELIMAAGFSTNETVTEYSGRGVGMDVVKKNLEKIGGTLLVESDYGKGSSFTIRVPMSLSISDCMGIKLAGQEYAAPVSALSEIFCPSSEQLVFTPDGKEMVLKDGKLYRIIPLSKHFGLDGCETDYTKGIMLLCATDHGEAALFADGIIGDMQIVVKPFSAYLSRFGLKESGFSGTSVLGDGSIILNLDINEIIRRSGGADR